MQRLTDRAKNRCAYLVNVKEDEQEVDSPYKNTLQCILDCINRLAAYEDTGATPEQCAHWAQLDREKRLVVLCGCEGCKWLKVVPFGGFFCKRLVMGTPYFDTTIGCSFREAAEAKERESNG